MKAQKKTGKADKTPLIIWSSDPNASAVLGLDMLDRLPDPETIATGAQAPEMLLLCMSPIRFLCHEMAQREGLGTTPGAALDNWMDQARAVLAVNRRNRRRVHILDITRTLADPASLLARFGVKVPEIEPETEMPPDTRPDTCPDPVLALLAQRCLDGNAAARALAGELEAVMADSGQGSEVDPDAAFEAWRTAGWASEEVGLLRTQLSLMQEETDLVQAQGRAAEAELQELSENALLLEQRLVLMTEAMASYQAQLDQHLAEKALLANTLGEKEAALSAAGEMMRGLEAQANELNAALSQARTALGVVEADRDGIVHHRDILQSQVQELETSHSYRVTAPLRALRALFSNKG